MKKWEYVNECMVVGLDNISLTITAENVQDGWEMSIAEISAKIPDLSKVTITFYGWLSMQDIKNKVLIENYNKFFPHSKGETPKVKQIFTLDECSKKFDNKPLMNSNSSSCYSTIKNEHRRKITFLPIQQVQKNNKSLIKSTSMPKIAVKKNKEELLESFMNEYKGIVRKIKREKMKFIKRNIQSMDEIDKMMDTRTQIEVFKLKEKYKSLSMTNVNY